MRLLRTVLSALCILLGALLIVGWVVGNATVRAVEDGTLIDDLTAAVIANPVTRAAIADEASGTVMVELDKVGIDLVALGLDDTLRDLVTTVVESDQFEELAKEQSVQLREQIGEQLMAEDREPAPLVVAINLSDSINQRVGDLPVVGALAPDVAVPPVQLVLVDADRFEEARTAYSVAQFAAEWFLWIGLGFLALGILVSPRRRWFLAKLFFAVAVFAGVAWAVLTYVDPITIAGWMPGGVNGGAGTLVADILRGDSAPSFARATGLTAAAAGILAVVCWLIARLTTRRD